ncbi:MAG: hypothetical protein R3322_11160 [Kiloniellales bacterium]|jgi:hypothetical protein|nr:hypothetical protein [Kiloniellales bacterium]
MRTADVLQDYQIASAVDFDGLASEELEAMALAGQQVVEVYRILAKTGDNVVGELLRGTDTFYEWDHYPKGDVYDRETHSQYYYHAHAADQRFPGEHGHFHTFLRPKGMPPGLAPADIPGRPVPEDPNDELSHLIAIAMTPAGFPFRLFTTNRWVTGESWYRAEDVIALLAFFNIDHARPSWPANRWITAMLALFKPQIVELVRARDRAVAAWAELHRERDVYEDRELEIASYMEIDVEAQIRAVSQALLKRT